MATKTDGRSPMNPQARRDAILYAKEEGVQAPEKVVDFINHYLSGMDIYEAWHEAGLPKNGTNRARLVLREHWRLVDKMLDERIGEHAPAALARIVHLMNHASSDTVKLNAAKDILSRAGKDKPIQLTHTSKEPEELEEDELDQEIAMLASRLNIQGVRDAKGDTEDENDGS